MQNGGVTSSTDTTNGAYARARAEGRGGVHEFSPCLPLVTPPPCLPLNRIHTSPPKKGTILHNKHKQTLHLKVDGITPGNLTTRLLYIQTHTHTHTHTHNMACAGDCCGAVAQHWRQRQRRWQRRKARTIAGAGTKINFEKKWRLSQRAKYDGRAMWPWCARHAGRGRAHGRGPASLGRGTGHGAVARCAGGDRPGAFQVSLVGSRRRAVPPPHALSPALDCSADLSRARSPPQRGLRAWASRRTSLKLSAAAAIKQTFLVLALASFSMGADIPGVYSNFRSREISVPREPHPVPRQRYGRCETSRGDWNLGAGWGGGEWVPAPWYVGVRIGEAGHPGPERERHKGRKRKLTPEQSF